VHIESTPQANILKKFLVSSKSTSAAISSTSAYGAFPNLT
jgi:hypothetical protein